MAIVALAATAALTFATGSALAAPAKGGAANLAMIGEPQTLDPMASTADLVGTIMQHVYELLYTYDANSNVVAHARREHADDVEGRPRLHDPACARVSSSTTARR